MQVALDGHTEPLYGQSQSLADHRIIFHPGVGVDRWVSQQLSLPIIVKI